MANAQETQVKENAISRRLVHPIRDYLRDTWAELKKVTWPTREEAINLTLIVLAVTIFMALFLGALDIAFTGLVTTIVKSALGL